MSSPTLMRGAAVAALSVVAVAVGLRLAVAHVDDATGAAPRRVTIDEGMSATAIGDRLETLGLIRSARWFVALARWRDIAGQLEAGTYRLDGARTTSRLLDDLLEAPLELTRVTIPEGRTRHETAALLARAGLADSARFVEVTADPALARELGITAPTLEGYLFPETYLFPDDTTEEQIARHMVRQFFEVFSDAHFERLGQTGQTLHQAVTLASIVELEAVAPQERPLIAAIFLRRLALNRRLESCATIEFALGEHKARLTNEDLKVKSPYNTYQHRGLPPGPIGNPGEASLQATLYPVEQTEYLYFVARGDGTHIFSRTNVEHNAAKHRVRREARAAAAAMSAAPN